jgi:hypothetical protein
MLGFSPTSFPLRVLSTAILNWVNSFVNKKLQKNAWPTELTLSEDDFGLLSPGSNQTGGAGILPVGRRTG